MPTPISSAVLRDQNGVPFNQEWNNNAGQFETVYGAANTIFSAKPMDPTGAFTYSTTYSSTVLEAGNVIKSSSGTLYRLYVTSTAPAQTYYIQLFNATSLPADGANPKFRYFIQNGSTTHIDLSGAGYYFSTGIVFMISTNPTILAHTTNSLWLVDAFGA